MSLQLDWPSDMVDRVSEDARRKGLSLDAFVLEAIQKNGCNDVPVDDAQRLSIRREAAASIRERRKGAVLGPELTVRELVEEGRRF